MPMFGRGHSAVTFLCTLTLLSALHQTCSLQSRDHWADRSASEACPTSSSPAYSEHHEYCVIGAGPAGLQVGYFLERASRDYLVFERSDIPGSFFRLYPRHDKLISINKRNTGRSNKEFNLRHDWNSLISDDDSLRFKHYSKEFFPHRKDLLRYLKDYQEKLKIRVSFNTTIKHVERPGPGSVYNGLSYTVENVTELFVLADQNSAIYTCRYLVVATGIAEPYIPKVRGIEHAVGYEDMSLDPKDYEGKTVLILGRGNSAFEVAQSIYGHTNLIHMIGRSRVRLSWSTHYVGDLRGVNNELLDTYQLKSLDAVLEAAISDCLIEKTPDGRIALSAVNRDLRDVFESDGFPMREHYDVVIRCLGFVYDDSLFSARNTSQCKPGTGSDDQEKTKEGHASADHTARTKTHPGYGVGRKQKFPNIKHNYEAVKVPNMYFAGALSHSLDFRKSAGGFIHGYRYTARALHRLLEWRNHGIKWPYTTHDLKQLLPVIIKRINEGSGIYQMFYMLGDVYILNSDSGTFDMLREFPVNLLAEFTQMTGHTWRPMIVMLLEYGHKFSGPGEDVFRIDRAHSDPANAHESNFLHPVFYYYVNTPTEEDFRKKPDELSLPTPHKLHVIVEDFLTNFNGRVHHILPLRRFLDSVLRTDLTNYYSDWCFRAAMTHVTVPRGCEHYRSDVGGLTGEDYLLNHAYSSGLMNYGF